MSAALAIKLIVEDDSGQRTAVPVNLDARGELIIGRAAECGLRLDERNVSRRHAKLLQTPEGLWQVHDLGAYNGIKVNQARIAHTQDVSLGDILRIGDFQLEIRSAQEIGAEITRPTLLIGNDEGTVPEGNQRAIARQIAEETTTPGPNLAAPVPPRASKSTNTAPDAEPPQPDRAPGVMDDEPTQMVVRVIAATTPNGVGPAPTPPYAKLLCLMGDMAGIAFELKQASMIIGRTKDNDIAIPHRSMSRHHAKVIWANGRYRILDLDSANGLLVNDETYTETDLQHGDVAELGHVRLRFVGPSEVAMLTSDEREQANMSKDQQTRRAGRKSSRQWAALACVTAAIFGSYAYLSRQAKVPSEPPVAAAGQKGITEEIDHLMGQARQATALRQYARAETLASAVLALDPSSREARQLISQCDAEQKGSLALESAVGFAAREEWPQAFNALKDVPKGSTSATRAATLLEQVRPSLVQLHVDAVHKALLTEHIDEAQQHIDALAGMEMNNSQLPELHKALDEAQKKHQHALTEAANSKASTGHSSSTSTADGRGTHSNAGSDEPRQLYNDGTKALGQNKYSQAIDLFTRCVNQDKTFARCYRALGITYAKNGNGPKAVKNYKQYLKVDPSAKDASSVKQLLQQYENTKEHSSGLAAE